MILGLCLLRKKKKEVAAAENLAPVAMWCVGVARSSAVVIGFILW